MRYDHRKTEAHKKRASGFKKKGRTFLRPDEKKKRQKIFPIEELHLHTNLVARKCPTCHKEFAIRKCQTGGTQSWCSSECWQKGRTEVDRYTAKMSQKSKSLAKRILDQTGFFKQHKDEYKDKIIDHLESPTGKAYVGINKSPFMPAADGGHGFQGVLLQDENRELVQCHACGKWMQKIASKHLEGCSGLTMKEYKTKYGLNEDEGLVSDETSLRLTKACLKNKAQRTFAKNPPAKGKTPSSSGHRHSMAFFNKYGTCPLQLETRLYEFIRCNRELPSQNNRGRAIYKALCRRHGSFGHALAAHGLPWLKRQGTTMRFAFSDGTVYKFYDREALFNLMMEKCPVLTSKSAA